MSDLGKSPKLDGYGVAKGLVSKELCDELKKHIMVETKKNIDNGNAEVFGKVREPDNRYDLMLEMVPCVRDVVNQIVSKLKGILADAIGSQGARLIELAAITSHPGAASQPVHADTVHGVLRYLQADTSMMLGLFNSGDDSDDDEACNQVLSAVATDTAPMWTVLAPLQDVTEDMGPTHVWPGTNTLDFHSLCYSHYAGPGGDAGGQTTNRSKLSIAVADDLFQKKHTKMTLNAGDAVFYDSRTMHCGGANTSTKSRTVLVLTFVGNGMMPEGSTYDLLPKLLNKYRLSSFPLTETGESRPKLQIDIEQEEAFESQRREEEEELRKALPVPPLNEWKASVQCTKCGKWRPCDPLNADSLTRDQWRCKTGGYSCFTAQLYTVEEIDTYFEEE
eukprot:TRINITY_DN8569_c6_g1_i1.p1 TRINITY_DN8569_c6_g1~~TRINITY_DN8569_c6_g1_i1.p1  ORF type:complete len:409 (+),score=92.11 TRINITY_DN8569_c6_g1_i1:57-1229(+)